MDWQFKVGIGVAVVFGLLPYAVKDMPHALTWAGVAVGVLFVIWGVLPHHDRIPIGPGLLFIASVAGLIGAGVWGLETSAGAPRSEKPPDGNGFYMECNQQFGPLKVSSVGLYFAMINETGGGGLSHLPVTDPSQEGQEYRISNDKMIEILQCKLNNYETLPALDTTLSLTVLFRKVARSGIIVSEGEIVGQRVISLPFGQYGKIDPGAANSFTFYIANRSEIIPESLRPESLTSNIVDLVTNS
jgi:hypothetical protein